MRTVALVAAAVVGAAATAFMAMVGHAMSAMYGTAPDGGGAGETVGWVAQFAAPAVLVVMALLYAASTRTPIETRRRLVIGGGSAALVVMSVAVLLGSRA